MKQTFRDGFGNTILHLEYVEAGNYIYAAFYGFQTLSLLEEASELALRMVQEKACTNFLSDNSRMLGGKDFAYDFILTNFAPRAIALGLKRFAYVLPPAMGNPQTVKNLEIKIPPGLEFMLFDTAEEARHWLLRRYS